MVLSANELGEILTQHQLHSRVEWMILYHNYRNYFSLQHPFVGLVTLPDVVGCPSLQLANSLEFSS